MKLAFFFMAALSIIFGCSTNNQAPAEVLEKFFKALSSQNIEEAKKYVTRDSEGMMNMVQMGMQKMGKNDESTINYSQENMEIGKAEINGDKALVPVKDKKSGELTDFTLRKEDGNWKVAFDKSTIMEMATRKMKEHGVGKFKNSRNDSIRLDSAMMQNMDSITKEAIKKMKEMPEPDDN